MIPLLHRISTGRFLRRRFLILYLVLGASLAATEITASRKADAETKGQTIRYDAAAHSFRLDGADVSYILGVTESGDLQALYWGKRLRNQDPSPVPISEGGSGFELPIDASPHEFVGWGGGFYGVPNLKVSFPDGNRDLVLHYLSYTIREDTLTVKLKDINRDVIVDLVYEMDPATGILARSAHIENRTKEPFTIEEAFAATWNLPSSSDYQLRYLTGRWASEFNLQEEALHPGKVVLESRRGSTGDEVNPWFAIERGAQPDQDTGDVWFGALAWSGSWQINIEQNAADRVRVTGGFTRSTLLTRLNLGNLWIPRSFMVVSRMQGSAERLVCFIALSSVL